MRKNIHFGIRFVIALCSLFAFLLAGGLSAVAEGGHEVHMTSHDHMNMAAKTAAGTVDIVRDPVDVPPPIGKRPPAVVRVTLTAKEVIGKLDPASGTTYRYWTFNGKVPAPMVRVRQGDTVEVTLHNDASSHMAHSVDFHAVLGLGGGAAFSQAVPGQSKTFSFQATTPGLFVYHCGTPMIADHIANGMYGLILVEPAAGLAPVDHEYYVMQGEIYTAAPKGKAGLQQFSEAKLLQEDPQYYVFNGAVDALTKERPMQAKVGETVRIFFGDAGPNKPSSLHMVGEIFTEDYQAGALTAAPLTNVQTAIVAPGSAAMLQLKTAEPGQFNIMDHAMSRMSKGLMATLNVTGPENAALIHSGPAATDSRASVNGMTAADIAEASTSPALVSSAADVSTDATEVAPATPAASAARPSPAASAKTASSPTELNGCLRMQSNGNVTLKLINSPQVYRLEARPLLFAENADRLVRVSGHLGSVVGQQDLRTPSFVVDSVDALASNCSAKITPAMLQEGAADSAGASAGPAVRVGMTDMAFTPAKIVINAGQTVVWKNTSEVVHNVVDDANKAVTATDVALPAGVQPFGSDYLQPGQTFSRVFTKPGTYRYVCTLHEGNGMKGVVVVR